MPGVLDVPKKAEKPKVESLKATLKITESFKEMLEEVSRFEGVQPGRLVEVHMGQWLKQEYMRVSREKAAALIKKADQIQKELG